MAIKGFFSDEFSKYPATCLRANQLGEKFYFTGKPCARGHLDLRYASSGNCVECIREKKNRCGKARKTSIPRCNAKDQELANIAIDNGFTVYESLTLCPHGHSTRFVSSNNCVECNKKQMIDRSIKYKWSRIKKEYGINEKEFNEILEKQKSKCPICNKDISEKNHIDHCHKTGKVRGILCNKCNQALGLFDEKIENFLSAISYLEKNK